MFLAVKRIFMAAIIFQDQHISSVITEPRHVPAACRSAGRSLIGSLMLLTSSGTSQLLSENA